MIFLAGHHNSGKSTVALHLRDVYGFLHIETGEIVRELYTQSGTSLPFGEWASASHHMFDKAIASRICEHVTATAQLNGKVEDVVVTGNRQIEGIRYITDRVDCLPGKSNLIFYFEADPKILHTRHLVRTDRPTPRLTFNEFDRELLAYDREMGVEKIRDHAHVTIRNEGSIEDFLSSVISELHTRGYKLENRVSKSHERVLA